MSEQTIEQPRDDAGRFAGADPYTQSVGTEVSDAMSKAVDKGDRPFDAFKEMPRPQPVEKPDTFGSDVEGMKSAAQELTRKRQGVENDAPVIRHYHTVGKPNEVRSPVETVKLADAARDLKDLRQAEADTDELLENLSLREKLDRLRQEADAEDRGTPALEGVPQPQPEAQPEPTAPPQQTNGVDPEVRRLIENNPKLREALAQEAQMTAQARYGYDQAMRQAYGIGLSAAIEAFPEIAGPNPQAALEQLRLSNPVKFAEIAGRLQKIGAIHNHMQQSAAHQQQQELAQWQASAERHDQDYDSYASTRPAAENKAVKERVLDVVKSYGIDERQFAQMYRAGHPFARSGAVQRMIHDLTVLALAREAAHKAPANVGRVMRPGEVSTGGVDNSQLAAAMKAFNADANPRNAAKALSARRRAAAALK
jgi:hypothetical protein